MLVMSLSPYWAKPFRTSPKQPKSLFFLGGALVPAAPECQNLTLKTTRCTRRGIPGGSWVVQGAVLGHAFGTLLGLPAVQVALFTNSSVSFRPNCDKFLKFSVLAGSAKHSRPVSSTTS